MAYIRADKMPLMALVNLEGKAGKYKAISFFSGMGGASIGMKMAGFNVLYANEFISQAADAYDLNHGLKADRRDIRHVDPVELLKSLRLKPGELDLMEGSPPCKLFSKTQADMKGKQFKREADKLPVYSENVRQRVDDLFFEFIRVLRHVKPKVFIAENVTGLTNNMNRHYFFEISNQFEDCGYVVQAVVIDASRLGVPQRRERLVFQGIRKDLYERGMRHTWPKMKAVTTVKECLPNIEQVFYSKEGYRNAATWPSPTVLAGDYDVTEHARYSSGGWVEDTAGVRRKWTIPELKVVSSVPRDFRFPKYEGETPLKRFYRSWERLGRIHAPLAVYHVCRCIKNGLDKYA